MKAILGSFLIVLVIVLAMPGCKKSRGGGDAGPHSPGGVNPSDTPAGFDGSQEHQIPGSRHSKP